MLNLVYKEGVSYLQRTAQPFTFACFRTWRVEGSWSYKTYPGTKVEFLFDTANKLNRCTKFFRIRCKILIFALDEYICRCPTF